MDMIQDAESTVVLEDSASIVDPALDIAPVLDEEIKVDPVIEETLAPSPLDTLPTPTPLDNPDQMIDESAAAAAAAAGLSTPKHRGKHDGGLSLGGFLAIGIFMTIIIFVFRKCRELTNQAPASKRSTSDHLRSLL